MPELPEVETTRRGIEPHVVGRRVAGVAVRESRLRWPVPADLQTALAGETVRWVTRRAKYLLLELTGGTLLIHLGMSGSLLVLKQASTPGRHDHVDIEWDDGSILRYSDPRRFGSLHWIRVGDPIHRLLANLGPEPLSPGFNGHYLHGRSRSRRQAVKSFIMDGRIVAGVGNIYAAEALFRAGIRPSRQAGRISRARYERLASAIRTVLAEAICKGGTTLRDFVAEDGRPGYFQQALRVYGRSGGPCVQCGERLRSTRIGQRATVYCGHCQR